MNKIETLDQNSSTGAAVHNFASKVQNKFEPHGSILERLLKFALSVQDFRRTGKGNLRYRLSDIIMLLVLARLSNCISRADIIEFGKHNLGKFRRMGMFSRGIPSEATLCRIENGIDNQALAEGMQKFAEEFHRELLKDCGTGEIICIDGKAECGTVLASGRCPDIVSAYSPATGITLATEACQEKSNEIKAVPLLIDKIDIAGKVVTADAMSMQKAIIDKIRSKEGYFLIEVKANQPNLRYRVEDRLKLKQHTPVYTYTEGPELVHGRIETRTYRIYDGLDLIADKEKWGGTMTVVECESETIKKSTGERTTEKRLYVTSLPADTPCLGAIVRRHWSIESMHWQLDCILRQDHIKRKSGKSARNLDTIQRIVLSTFSIWRCLRRKLSDKRKGVAQLMRHVSMSFTKLIRFLSQK